MFTVPPPAFDNQEDELGEQREIKDITPKVEEPIRHVDTMTAVAQGKRWLVRDEICAAASYFLKKFRDFRKAEVIQDSLVETQNQLIRKQDGLIAEFKANAEVAAKKYETCANELRRNLHEEKIKHKATTDELNQTKLVVTQVRNETDRLTEQFKQEKKKSDDRFNAVNQNNKELYKEIDNLQGHLRSQQDKLEVAERSLAKFTDDRSKMLRLLEESYIHLEKQVRKIGEA